MLLTVNLLLLSNMLLGSWVKALYSLTAREVLNIAGILSTNESKELSDRWHSCLCGESLERDKNLAKLIKKIVLNYESGSGSTLLKKALASREKEACGLTVPELTVWFVHQ